VHVDWLKGKALIPESGEINLAEMIDVKGMKAQGNRLSPNEIKKIELIAEHDDPEDVPDPVAEVSLAEVVLEEKLDDEAEKEISQKEEENNIEISSATEKPVPVSVPEPVKQVRKVDFEITNPDDIEIDDKGQLGLF